MRKASIYLCICVGVSMIAKLIYEGKTAIDLGLSDINYQSRKDLLERFLLAWDKSGEFKEAYTLWISSQEEGIRAFPPLRIQAATFIQAAKQYVQGGFATVPDEIHTQRLQFCEVCEHLQGSRCVKCGCYMPAKTWLPTQHCPVGLWKSYQGA